MRSSLEKSISPKVAFALGFLIFIIIPGPVSSDVVFDITHIVDSESPSLTNEFGQMLENSTDGLAFQFYYKTDLPLLEFFKEKLGNVTLFLDTLILKHGKLSNHGNFILEFLLTKNKSFVNSGYGYNNETVFDASLIPGIERISGVVITYSQENLDINSYPFYILAILKMNESFKRTINVGFSGNLTSIPFLDISLKLTPWTNILFVSIHVTTYNYVPSYSLLKSFLKKTFDQILAPIYSKYRNTLTITYNSKLSHGDSDLVSLKYHKFVVSVSAQLANQSEYHLIVEPYITETTQFSFTGGTLLNQQNFIIPAYLDSYVDYRSTPMAFLETGSKIFSTYYMDSVSWECILYCSMNINHTQQDCCAYRRTLSKIFREAELKIILEIDPKSSVNWEVFDDNYPIDFSVSRNIGLNMSFIPYRISSLEKLKVLNEKFTCTIPTEGIYKENETSYFFSPNITIFNLYVEKVCNEFLNITDQIIWDFQLDLEFTTVDYERMSKEFEKLEFWETLRVEFIKENPKIEILYRFHTSMPLGVTDVSVYCSKIIQNQNQVFESVANWAAMRNARVIINELRLKDHGWIQRAPPPFDLSFQPETFTPLLRNYPSSASTWLGKLNMCIEPITETPNSGITLNKNVTGVVFNFVQNNSLSVDELGMMLKYVVHKYSRVLVQLGEKVENVKNLKSAFSQFFQEIKEIKGYPKVFQVYLQPQFPSEASAHLKYCKNLDELVNALKNPTISFIGFHQEIWKNMSQIRIPVDFRNPSIIKGVCIDDCVSFLENYLKKTPEARKGLESDIKYVVCETNIAANAVKFNEDVSSYLDGFLVMGKTFRKLFPQLEQIHFVLFLSQFATVDMLKTYSDFGQFAEGYELSYFFGPAFDHPSSDSSGWWRIENYEDLANVSVYIEKEAEYLGKPTWRPVKNPPSSVSNLTIYLIWGIAGGVTALVVVAISVGFIIGRKSKLLTKDEAYEFLYGIDFSEEGDENNSSNDLSSMGFISEYGIPKVHNVLESCTILGMGNFGTVVKTMVGNEFVALKIPNDGCSKHSFKSMLTEVKLLCYIGEHVNVIKFVGAYVKEISKGVIQIATVLCENGSLQSYLRGDLRTVLNDGNVEDNGPHRELVQFAKEIASGMAYIGSKNVVHGDLSTRNVLLDGNNTCKIADFGLARKLYKYSKYVKKSQEPLPWRWMAHESLEKMEFTIKSDMWSYGVTLWEIFSLGAVPYAGLNWSVNFVEEIRNGLRLPLPRFSSPEIFAKMENSWNLDPEARITFEDMKGFFIGFMNSDYETLFEV